MAPEIFEALNVNHPGKTHRVDAVKFRKACAGLLSVLPTEAPGLNQSEMIAAARAVMPDADFPGSTQGWWIKGAQLHLEAVGEVVRDKGKPLRWRRAG